jgi:Glycosyl hydrolases family 16
VLRKFCLAAVCVITLVLCPSVLLAAQSNKSAHLTRISPHPHGIAGDWRLVFDDDFNGPSLKYNLWGTNNGYTNQNAVTDHSSNVHISGGYATLTLASPVSGATLETIHEVLGVGEVAEARIRFAGVKSKIYNWPAFWAAGHDWPYSGENDVAEGLSNVLTVNYHSPSGWHNQGSVRGAWGGGFHTYAVQRLAHESKVFWDGRLVKRYPTDDNGGPEHLILEVGAAGPPVTGVASQMLVDYVRVWAPASASK